MKDMISLSLLLLAGCGQAQDPDAKWDPTELIATHYGGTPQDAALIWTPKADEVGHFEYVGDPAQFGNLVTTVDTILHPTAEMALVLFRTAREGDAAEAGMMCMLCEDQLGLAVYSKEASGWTLVSFDKWFHAQGVYDAMHKPELMGAGPTAQVMRIISSDGEPEHNSTTHYLIGIPGMQEVLSITTDGIEVTRGGPYGPMEDTVSREYAFIPSDKEWYDVEVTDGETPKRYTWSAGTKKYEAAEAPGSR